MRWLQLWINWRFRASFAFKLLRLAILLVGLDVDALANYMAGCTLINPIGHINAAARTRDVCLSTFARDFDLREGSLHCPAVYKLELCMLGFPVRQLQFTDKAQVCASLSLFLFLLQDLFPLKSMSLANSHWTQVLTPYAFCLKARPGADRIRRLRARSVL